MLWQDIDVRPMIKVKLLVEQYRSFVNEYAVPNLEYSKDKILYILYEIMQECDGWGLFC